MSLPLLQTKLYVPPPRLHLVRREPLLARLQNQQGRPLTLVAAPAGFGKTTLISEWLAQRKQAVAWLSLDADDNDPIRFLSYLLAAIQTHYPQIGEAAVPLLTAPQPAPPNTILTLLLNDLSGVTSPLVLVLDDYHLIQAQPIHEALIFLIDHLPATVQLVITSRIDPPLPLSRWRVRNQLTEIRAADLRFSRDEAAHFLNEVMGLQLTSQDIATLETRTEGWIAGLQLAALSMHGRSDLANFIAHFTGSHSYIIDYLAEEVLQRQSEEVQTFLLQTALLERFCAPLCDAITGRNDGQAMLAQLQRANLFLIALDDERQWYRYHHLFAEVLRNRLQHNQPEKIATLHLRASVWCEGAGLPDEAVHHALAAQNLAQAVSLIERHSIPLLLHSQVIVIKRWLQSLPTTLIESRPQLAIIAAWVYMTSRQLTQLTHLLNEVPALQSPALDDEMRSQLLILRASLRLFEGDFGQAIAYARQSLPLVPAHLASLRTTALLILGSGYAQSDDPAQAEPILHETIVVGKAGGNLYNVMLAYHILSRFQSSRGKSDEAFAILNAALQVATQQGQPLIPAVGVIYIGLGALWVETGHYEQAEADLKRGEELTKACFQLDILLYGWQAQVKLHLARGNQTQALAVLADAEAWLNSVVLTDTMRRSLIGLLHTLHSASQLPAPPHVAKSATSQTLIESLSERELEILRLVNDGLSNGEIAEKLIVTVGTVKKHLNNIFGKLGVGSRTQALVRARAVNLL